LHLHPPCKVPDGSYTLVPADEDEGAGGDVHYVTVEQDLDQSPEGPKASFANEGKPRFIINPCCLKLGAYQVQTRVAVQTMKTPIKNVGSRSKG
jgi:hypothetical protein